MDPAISSFFIYLYSIPIFVANVAILLVSILCLGVTFVAGGKPIPFSKFPFNLITLLTMNNLLSSIVWTFGVTLNWSIAKIVGPDWLSKGTLGELLSYFNEIVLHGGKFFFAFNATQFLFLYLIGFVTFLLKPFDDGKIFESRYLLGVFVVSALMTFICLLCDFLWLEAKEDLLNKCAEMFRGCVIVFCVLTTFLLVFRINQLEGTKEICRIKRRIAFQFASLVVYCIVVLTPDAISSFMCYGGGNYTSLSNSTVVIINSILAVDHSVIGIVTFIYCLCIPLMKTELVLAFKSLFCFSIEPAMRRGRSRAYSYEGNVNHSLRESGVHSTALFTSGV